MPEVEVSTLTAETAAADTDLSYLVKDNGGGTWLSRRITIANLIVKAYGSVYVTDGSGSQSLTADTWTKVTQFTANGLSKNATPDHTNDRVRVTNVGKYRAWYSCSFATPSASKTIELAAYWNGAPTQVRSIVKTDASGSVVCAFAQDVVNVTTGATDFELYARSNGASATLDVKHAQLGAERSV